ncbi:MAG: adenosine kinase [Bacteriovoracaceae bacterium]|nr:adenosine kinase [Bacteriovoracaceae bacterium]
MTKQSGPFELFGMGNALVDFEFTCDFDFLEKNKISRSMMTLVDAKTQAAHLALLEGNMKKRQCGGSAANTLIAFGQAGGKAHYACKVADDHLGRFYLDDLGKNHVHASFEKKMHSGTTGTCLVMITPDSERTMETHLGITSEFSINDVDLDILAKSTSLYIEGYLFATDLGQQAAIKAEEFARARSIDVCLTFSDASIIHAFHKKFESFLKQKIQLLFANEGEAIAFTGCREIPDMVNALKEVAEEFVITRSEKGALIYNGSKLWEIPGRKVKAIDANGAGDMFAGAYLFGRSKGWDVAKRGEFACHAASEVITKYGPRLTTEELQKILVQYK